MNRSIQAEGSFGEIKQDMGFRRFLCKGKQNVLAYILKIAIEQCQKRAMHQQFLTANVTIPLAVFNC